MGATEPTAAPLAIVTGAGGGIGTAVALQFAVDGYALALVDRDEVQLERLSRRIKTQVPGTSVAVYVGDVADGSDVGAYVGAIDAEFGAPRVLVNGAGIVGSARRIHEFTEDEFDAVWSINARGTWLNIRSVAPLMLEAGVGAIVNIASVAGIRSSVLLAPYVASKHAVVGLTRAAASDLAHGGIRVNAVCPGPVDTQMMDSLSDQRSQLRTDSGNERARLTSNVLLKRFADPTEIASVIAFLASDSASFITGAVVVADGGLTA